MEMPAAGSGVIDVTEVVIHAMQNLSGEQVPLSSNSSGSSLLRVLHSPNFDDMNASFMSNFISEQEPVLRLAYLVVLSVATGMGNLLVLVAVLKFPSLRRPTNAMLGSLALSDFLVGTITVPLYTAWTTRPGIFDRSAVMCGLVLLSCLMMVTASQVSLLLLSVEQFLAVCHPFRHRNLLIGCPRLHTLGILFAWAASFLTAAVSLLAYDKKPAVACNYYSVFDETFLFVASICGVFFPFALIIYFNVRVLCAVKKNEKKMTFAYRGDDHCPILRKKGRAERSSYSFSSSKTDGSYYDPNHRSDNFKGFDNHVRTSDNVGTDNNREISHFTGIENKMEAPDDATPDNHMELSDYSGIENSVKISNDAATGHVKTSNDAATGHVKISSDADTGHVKISNDADTGHVKISNDAATGHVKISSDADTGHVKISNDADTGHVKISNDADTGHVKISNDADTGHVKISSDADTGHVKISNDADTGHVKISSDADTGHVKISNDADTGHVKISSDADTGHVKISSDADTGHVKISSDADTGHLCPSVDRVRGMRSKTTEIPRRKYRRVTTIRHESVETNLKRGTAFQGGPQETYFHPRNNQTQYITKSCSLQDVVLKADTFNDNWNKNFRGSTQSLTLYDGSALSRESKITGANKLACLFGNKLNPMRHHQPKGFAENIICHTWRRRSTETVDKDSRQSSLRAPSLCCSRPSVSESDIAHGNEKVDAERRVSGVHCRTSDNSNFHRSFLLAASSNTTRKCKNDARIKRLEQVTNKREVVQDYPFLCSKTSELLYPSRPRHMYDDLGDKSLQGVQSRLAKSLDHFSDEYVTNEIKTDDCSENMTSNNFTLGKTSLSSPLQADTVCYLCESMFKTSPKLLHYLGFTDCPYCKNPGYYSQMLESPSHLYKAEKESRFRSVLNDPHDEALYPTPIILEDKFEWPHFLSVLDTSKIYSHLKNNDIYRGSLSDEDKTQISFAKDRGTCNQILDAIKHVSTEETKMVECTGNSTNRDSVREHQHSGNSCYQRAGTGLATVVLNPTDGHFNPVSSNIEHSVEVLEEAGCAKRKEISDTLIHSEFSVHDGVTTGDQESKENEITMLMDSSDVETSVDSGISVNLVNYEDIKDSEDTELSQLRAKTCFDEDKAEEKYEEVSRKTIGCLPLFSATEPFRQLRLRRQSRSLSISSVGVSRKVRWMVALVCATFILAWFPFFVVILVNMFCDSCTLNYFLNAVIMVAFSKSMANPVVYALCHVEFRRAYGKVFKAIGLQSCC
ncbi:hypothetical protein RRG08_045083 [Elysia crispata]|uniref:G-protein coupled receptors family 1 profile domain-containing protein n=1 Tax=Elysia crispata TaxID=231223 RepID=A0AAE1D4W4_9GAST|nr:hypothetical protein RRG08_045083 [Elysia crispata]